MADSDKSLGTAKPTEAELVKSTLTDTTLEQPSASDKSNKKLPALPEIFFSSCSHCQELEEKLPVVLIKDPREEPGQLPNALKYCEFVQKEITHFLTEETQYSLDRASPEQTMKRAKDLIASMEGALQKLEQEFPIGKRNLWIEHRIYGHRIYEYKMAMHKLRDFIW